MSKSQSKKITHFQLIKVEKKYNGLPPKYFYNLGIEGIESFLILESDENITERVIGKSIKYKLNEENEVIDFDFI
jgi:hypothetical protein